MFYSFYLKIHGGGKPQNKGVENFYKGGGKPQRGVENCNKILMYLFLKKYKLLNTCVLYSLWRGGKPR